MKNYFLHQQQTATDALNAYSSAAAIPVVGYIIAPIAAAIAVAAGAMQVAAIKKQQQASQAQGYGEGGFTRKVASPVARPLIEALDYAQRTNTIGSLRSADVCINWAAARQSASEFASALASPVSTSDWTSPLSPSTP